MLKDQVRALNRTTSLQIMLLIVVTQIATAILAYKFLYISQSDLSKLDTAQIQEYIQKLQDINSLVCVDAAGLSREGASWEPFVEQYGELIRPCQSDCLCVKMSENRDLKKTA